MKAKTTLLALLVFGFAILVISARTPSLDLAVDSPAPFQRYLYVAVPGIRDYLGYGGQGILVYDIDRNINL